MFIVPVTGQLSRRHLPLVTIGLILINCLIFFIFQSNQTRQHMEAEGYYFTSGLAEIEMSRFLEYRNRTADESLKPQDLDRLNDEELAELYLRMRQDGQFEAKLRNEEIITPRDSEYHEWKQLRNWYEHLRSKIVSAKFGFTPAESKPVTFFSYMFLHGSFQHLLGNMIFLWLVGCMIEMGSSRIFCGASYLLTGLGAAVLFWLMHPKSGIHLVGASGAISGLMGAFCVLYGRKKVNFFYSLGVYFNYFKAPAIILLPVWIAKEIYFLYSDEMGNVAYEAHLGGLLAGALLGLIGFFLFRKSNAARLQADEPADVISPLIERALEHVSRLELDAATRLLEQALSRDPGHIAALTHLFNILKNDYRNPRFHETTRQLLARLTADSSCHNAACRVFEEYRRAAVQPCLSADLYLRMIAVLAGSGCPEKAEGIMSMFLKQKPNLPGIPQARLKLADGFRRKGKMEKYQTCLILLGEKYPESVEAQITRRNLQKPTPPSGAPASGPASE
jgi:membrane associated rhomboid family serine protease